MDRIALMNMLWRRRKTVVLSIEKVSFLTALAKPYQHSPGEFTEVDGDALAILRKAVTA